MAFALALCAFVALVAAAINGMAYRGLYFALAILAFVVGVVALAIVPTPLDLEVAAQSGDVAQVLGAEMLSEYAGPVGGWCLAVALGALAGGVAFRPRRSS